MTSAFSRLPNELLEMIVERVVEMISSERIHSQTETLLVLRRVHPHFAPLAAINRRVFETVHLVVDEDFVDGLRHAHYDTIGPYVRAVVFKISDYPDLQELGDVCDFKAVIRGNSVTSDIHSEIDIEEAWDEYHPHLSILARRSQRAFAHFLRHVRKDLRIEIGQWRWDAPRQSTRVGHAKWIFKHERLRDIRKRRGGELALQRGGDYLFDIAIKALADAERQPNELDLINTITSPYRMVWANPREFNVLDLSNLTNLRYAPQRYYEEYAWDDLHVEVLRNMQVEGGVAIHAILEKCTSSLKKLVVSGEYTPIRFPSEHTPEMPSLSHLELTSTAIEIRHLTRLVKSSPLLESLHVNGNSRPIDTHPIDFKFLFKAFREHKRNLRVSVTQLEVTEFFSFSCDLETEEPRQFEGVDECDLDEAYEATEAYITGTVGWIKPLVFAYGWKGTRWGLRRAQ